MRGVLSDPKAKWREFLAAEFHFHGAGIFYPRRAIRDARFKLIHNLRAGKVKPPRGIDGDNAAAKSATDAPADARKAFLTYSDPPEFELYDLAADPVEFRNVYGTGAHPGAEERLKKALAAWRKETGDPALDPAFVEMLANRKPG